MAHRAAQGLGAVQGLTALDPSYVSLRLYLLASLVLPARSLWLPVGKMAAVHAGQGKQAPGRVSTQMAHRAAQDLGAVQGLTV